MFKYHQQKISDYAIQSPNNTANVAVTVVLSIQQAWKNIGIQSDDVQEYGIESKYLFGHKKGAYAHVRANKKHLYNAIFYDDISAAERLLNVAGTPGLGLCKAGFVLQLCIGEAGCLDVHNLKRFGLSASTFKLGKVKYDTALRKAQLYLQTIDNLGGTEYLWDSWCEFMADKYPKHYQNANHVSRLHWKYLEK